MAVLAVVEDLFFRSKIETVAAQIGVPLCVINAPQSLPTPPSGSAWRLVIVDLNRSGDDSVEVVRLLRQALPTMTILGYCSHVQTDLKTRALQAGCTTVLPRSAFVQRLPELIAGK